MHDVLVLGAGPAGSTVARRLAAAGARVALIGGASRPGVEGLSERSRALLAEEGVPDVSRGPFLRRGTWGGRAVGGREWLIQRERLAEALLARARAAGAWYRGDRVSAVVKEGARWAARLPSGESVAAPLVIDARGRRGAERRGPLLLALGQRFRRRPGQAASRAEPGTQIEALQDGWCWWAVGEHSLFVQVVARPRARPPSQWLAAAAQQIPALAQLLEGAERDGEPVARPAHARLGAADGDPTRWRVGDSAFALDPLSGQGIYEALRGAALTATALVAVWEGAEAALAHRFLAERQAQAWARGVQVAADFYRENAQRSAFWADTAAAYAALAAQAPRVTAGTRRGPVLCEGRIAERELIVTAQHPRGVWHVAGVPLVPLKRFLEAAQHSTVAGAAAALDRTPQAVATAILWLQQAGLLAQRPAGIAPANTSSGG